MKKVVVGGAVVSVLVVTVFAVSFVRAQGRGRTVVATPFLESSGSYIGVSVRDVTADEAAKAKLQPAGGVVVEQVGDGSPAAQAGLRNGDILVEFDGERVRSARHFTRLVQETPSGRAVRTTYVREGARRTADITPQERDRGRALSFNIDRDRLQRQLRDVPNLNFRLDNPPQGRFDVFVSPRARLGVTLTPLDGQLAEYFGVKNGVLVSSVERDSPAGQAGVRAGDVITSVNGRTATSSADVTSAVRGTQPGGSVTLDITREKKTMSLTAKMPARVETPSPAAPGLPI